MWELWVWFRLLLNLVCIVGQMTICQYLCWGLKPCMDEGEESRDCRLSCFCPCTGEAEEPMQSCVCSAGCPHSWYLPSETPRKWWLNSCLWGGYPSYECTLISEHWGLYLSLFWFNGFFYLQKANEFQYRWVCKCWEISWVLCCAFCSFICVKILNADRRSCTRKAIK